MQRFFELVVATLREIFDEAPYQRFLARERIGASPASYRAFLADRRALHEKRPRCC